VDKWTGDVDNRGDSRAMLRTSLSLTGMTSWMMGWFRQGCAWIGTALAGRASLLLGRCGRVIHTPSALKTAPLRGVSTLSPSSPSLRQRRVLLQ
jgi:hypothetical protein